MIKKLVSATVLGLAATIGFGNQEIHAAAFPSIVDIVPFYQFQIKRSAVGPDGNNRFIWDYSGTSGYGGSVLWLLDPTGKLIGAGDTAVPASLGASNIALHVSPDNDTTLAFVYPTGAFGTWTYSPQGKLIAASGPTGFTGLEIVNIEFQKDFLVVTFLPQGQPYPFFTGVGPFTVWVLDHFGNLVSVVGPQGPYNGYVLGSVSLSGSSSAPNQLWHWLTVSGSGASQNFGLAVQEFSPSGNILTGYSYGPF